MSVHTVECNYFGLEEVAAAYLIHDGDRATVVETNTAYAVPRVLAALADEGLSPSSVEYVIVTHVHLDHAGGASALMGACPNATLLVHPRAAKHMVDPSKLVSSAKAVYGEARFEALYGTIDPIPHDRIRSMADTESVEFGSRELTFLHTRGHANHHVCVYDSATNGVFTGDAFGIVYPALQGAGRFAFPSTSPTDFDADEARRSVERILATGAERVYPTHFGEYRDLEEIAARLITQLDYFGGLVDEAFASDRDDAELERYFDARVRAHFDELLQAHGLADDVAVRELIETDVALNGQGLAFAVKKRRFKATQPGA